MLRLEMADMAGVGGRAGWRFIDVVKEDIERRW